MKVTITKIGSINRTSGEFASEQEARNAMVNDQSIESIRVYGLPLGETEWELTRSPIRAHKTGAVRGEDGIARIGWSNCD